MNPLKKGPSQEEHASTRFEASFFSALPHLLLMGFVNFISIYKGEKGNG